MSVLNIGKEKVLRRRNQAMPGSQESRDEQALTGDGEGKEELRNRSVRKVGDGRRPRTLYRDLFHNLPSFPFPMFASFTPTSFSVVKRKKQKQSFDLKGCPDC